MNTVDNCLNCLIKKWWSYSSTLDANSTWASSSWWWLETLLFLGSLGSSFSKNMWKLTSSLLPCNIEKLFQFTDLHNMTCVYFRVEDKLSVCIKTTPSCIQKKKLKLYFCVWTRMAWPRISESTFSSKTSSHYSWKTAQLSKMVCNSVLLTVQRFEHNAVSPEFPGAVSALSLFKVPSFLREYLIFFLYS